MLLRAPTSAQRALATMAETKPLLRGVVFDMDGTLTVPNLDFGEMYRRAGVPRGEDILATRWRADETACRVVEEMEAEGRRTLALMPGAAELAAWLEAHGVQSALVTRNSDATVAHFHKSLWRGAPLSPAISRDAAWPSKPDPAALLHIGELWRVGSMEEVCMVGDSPSNDVSFGRAAGAATALLDTGRRLSEGGETNGADLVVSNLAQLAALLFGSFRLASPLLESSLHAKRPPPSPATAAAAAAAAGDTAALASLSADKLAAHEGGPGSNTPLIWAAEHGHAPAIELLLRAGADANARGYLGNTAVSRAARRGHTAALEALLEGGADSDVPNDKLQFPLHFAAFKLNPEAVSLLLERGGSPLVLDRKGRTAAEDTADAAIRDEIRAAQERHIARALL
mmetsp:Transcript_6911/g.20768  ORF Transcript_6911/g.20768 Transcript_6911/m.20768 type:complete len:399 (-) Transcript_6911:88-1284(-)